MPRRTTPLNPENAVQRHHHPCCAYIRLETQHQYPPCTVIFCSASAVPVPEPTRPDTTQPHRTSKYQSHPPSAMGMQREKGRPSASKSAAWSELRFFCGEAICPKSPFSPLNVLVPKVVVYRPGLLPRLRYSRYLTYLGTLFVHTPKLGVHTPTLRSTPAGAVWSRDDVYVRCMQGIWSVSAFSNHHHHLRNLTLRPGRGIQGIFSDFLCPLSPGKPFV